MLLQGVKEGFKETRGEEDQIEISGTNVKLEGVSQTGNFLSFPAVLQFSVRLKWTESVCQELPRLCR